MDNYVDGDREMTGEIDIGPIHVKYESDSLEGDSEGLEFNNVVQMSEIVQNIKYLTYEKCPVCDLTVDSREWPGHQQNCWPKCTHCHIYFSSYQDLDQHYTIEHDVYEKNQVPGQTIQVINMEKDQKFLKKDQKMCSSNSANFECGSCTRSFSSMDDLIAHHNQGLCFVSLKCQHCNLTYQNQIELKNHILTHKNDSDDFDIRPCTDCDEIFEDLESLLKHQNTIHTTTTNGKNTKMDQESSSNLKLRMRFKCTTCSKIFVNREFLQKHQKSHQSNSNNSSRNDLPAPSQSVSKKPEFLNSKGSAEWFWFCDLCSKSYPSDSAMTAHHKSVHKSQDLVACTACNTIMLRSVKNYHKAKCALTCTICKMRFANKLVLEKHSQFHKTGESFSCTLCQKSYGSRILLKNHLISHQKYHDHKCTKCERIFDNFSDLQKHVGKCTQLVKVDLGVKGLNQNEKPRKIPNPDKKLVGTFNGKWYVCQSCSKSYPTKQTLYFHHNLVHKPAAAAGQPETQTESKSSGEEVTL